jgi:hypothetical protein
LKAAAPARTTAACRTTAARGGLVQEIFESAEAREATAAPCLPACLRIALVLAKRLGIEAFAQSLLSKLIIQCPFFLVEQDVARIRSFLELLLRLLVTGVPIGVVLARQLPVRLADLLLGRAALHAEDLVEVTSRHGRARGAASRLCRTFCKDKHSGAARESPRAACAAGA